MPPFSSFSTMFLPCIRPGRLSAMDLKKQIKAGNGQAELKTVSGGTLMVTTHEGHNRQRGELRRSRHAAAVKAAGLVATLKGSGPFTVALDFLVANL